MTCLSGPNELVRVKEEILLFAAAMSDQMFECFTKLRIPINTNTTNSNATTTTTTTTNYYDVNGNGGGFASVCLVRQKVVALLSVFLSYHTTHITYPLSSLLPIFCRWWPCCLAFSGANSRKCSSSGPSSDAGL